MWLNEGFTVFIERKVSGILNGADFAKVEALLGNADLRQSVLDYEPINPTYSTLHPVLMGDNADNSFSEVPYEKGFQLLTFLENIDGVGADGIQAFIGFHVARNSLTSITSPILRATWEEWVEQYFTDAGEVNRVLGSINFEDWLMTDDVKYDDDFFKTDQSDEARDLALAYIAGAGTDTPSNYADYNGWYSNLKVVFHNTLKMSFEQVDLAIVTKIDEDLDITADEDPEVRERWYYVTLSLEYTPVYTPAEAWVGSLGSLKYLTPVYQALEGSGQHDTGVAWLDENRDFYCPITVHGIEKTLNLDTAKKTAAPTVLEVLINM